MGMGFPYHNVAGGGGIGGGGGGGYPGGGMHGARGCRGAA